MDVQRRIIYSLDNYIHTHAHTHTLHTYTVPSGHILTREELQVLGALLARYSDEQLKSIQLSLQEEQEIRDISREEVEKSLRQSGLASMADGLKDDIEKGIACSGLLRQPQLMIVQRLVKCLYSALITNYCQLHDREYH